MIALLTVLGAWLEAVSLEEFVRLMLFIKKEKRT
jgi:hypothetical protein